MNLSKKISGGLKCFRDYLLKRCVLYRKVMFYLREVPGVMVDIKSTFPGFSSEKKVPNLGPGKIVIMVWKTSYNFDDKRFL